jgi:hypothetical protein
MPYLPCRALLQVRTLPFLPNLSSSRPASRAPRPTRRRRLRAMPAIPANPAPPPSPAPRASDSPTATTFTSPTHLRALKSKHQRLAPRLLQLPGAPRPPRPRRGRWRPRYAASYVVRHAGVLLRFGIHMTRALGHYLAVYHCSLALRCSMVWTVECKLICFKHSSAAIAVALVDVVTITDHIYSTAGALRLFQKIDPVPLCGHPIVNERSVWQSLVLRKEGVLGKIVFHILK